MKQLWRMFVDSEMLGSKKFRAFLIGVIVWALVELGVDVQPEAVETLLWFIASYMGSQGIVDFGKAFAEFIKELKLKIKEIE